ncbi:MAG: 4-hydroxy-tetrahydrodipicolinate synthase [Alphaproteobacteria bacterium]|nr:4-hydroxy-tetrahydrodipicolinate synthase [Alphaproteobacteria bacterium]
MIALRPDELRGSIPPLVTPFKDGAVDIPTFERLVERQIAEGSHGVLITGTTAEPSTLTTAERIKLFEVAVKVAKGRVPVVAAPGGQSHADTVEMVAGAEKAGVDAMLVVTPYFLRPPQRGLVEYYVDIGRRTALPLMIYHIPGRAAVNVTVDTVAAIAERAPNLVGIKHAVVDLDFATQLLKRMGMEFRIFVGLEELSFPMMAVGACGLMNAVGNLLPRRVAELCERVWANDLAGARAIHFELDELNRAVFFDTNPIPMKYMMRRLGILPNNEHRLPMLPATAELEARLDGVLARAGLIKLKQAAE